MRQYSRDEMLRIIERADFELRGREFKSPFAWPDKKASQKESIWLKECVIRAVLGLTNTPQGGWVIIGIAEDYEGRPMVSGVSEEERRSFEAYDAIKSQIDSFSSVPIAFEIGTGEFETEAGDVKTLVVLSVAEFEDLPAMCRRNGQANKTVLREGDIYVRAKKGQPATIRATEVELAEIIRMAADKQVADLRKRGYLIASDLAPQVTQTSNVDKFRAQTLDWDEL